MTKNDFTTCLKGLSKEVGKDIGELKKDITSKLDLLNDTVLLVKGDFSGIQEYLYKVNHAEDIDGRVAKRLRGRSFYLSSLCYAFSFELATTAGSKHSPYKNILYAQGGKFLIVLNASKRTRKMVTKWKSRTEKWLWRETWGAISMSIASVEATKNELGKHYVARISVQIETQLAHSKAHKYFEIFDSGKKIKTHNKNQFIFPLFREKKAEAFLEECHSCNDLPALGTYTKNINEQNICSQCSFHQYVGRYPNLPTHNYLEFKRSYFPKSTYRKSKIGFVRSIAFLRKSSNQKEMPFVPSYVPTSPYSTLTNPDMAFRSALEKKQKFCISCPVYEQDPNECGERQERLATRFHCMATIARSNRAAQKIGVLVLDGDNFSMHLSSTPHTTLVDQTMMSILIHSFFGKTLLELLRKYDCYLVYSGGDDLVLVGPWLNVYDLALELFDGFSRATDGHLHFSASLNVTNANEPIYESIKFSQQLLAEAKAYPGKNAIKVVATTIPWPQYRFIYEFAQELHGAIQNEIISIGFIYQLYDVYDLYENYLRSNKRDISGLRYASLLAAIIERNVRKKWSSSLPDDTRERRETLANQLVHRLALLTDHREDKILPYLRFALDWVALRNRNYSS